MAQETYLTVIGRLTGDPELRFTPSGTGVANFTVAANARYFDKNSNEWKNKPTTFWRCAAWNQGDKQRLGENVVDALKKGDSVIVRGEIESREYETREGEKRTVIELRVETIGKDLRWHQPAAGSGASTADEAWGGGTGGGYGGGGYGSGESPF